MNRLISFDAREIAHPWVDGITEKEYKLFHSDTSRAVMELFLWDNSPQPRFYWKDVYDRGSLAFEDKKIILSWLKLGRAKRVPVQMKRLQWI